MLGTNVHRWQCGCRQGVDVAGEQNLALVLIDQLAQRLVDDEQLGIGVLHHEVQSLLRITGVKWLIGAASLEHAQRGDGHPLASRNEHRHHILGLQSLADKVGGDAVANGIDLGIGVLEVFVDHSHVVGCGLCLATEERHDALRRVIIHIILVECVEQLDLLLSRDVDVGQLLAREHAFDRSLVALEQLRDQLM